MWTHPTLSGIVSLDRERSPAEGIFGDKPEGCMWR